MGTSAKQQPVYFFTGSGRESNCGAKLRQFLHEQLTLLNSLCLVFITKESTTEELTNTLSTIQANNKNSKAILITQNITDFATNTCAAFLTLGYYDITDGNDEDDLIKYITALAERNNNIEKLLNSDLVKKNMVGRSTVWKNFLYDLVEAASYSGTSILLTGESGTGKELASRLVHTLDQRPGKKELVLVDCTTVVPELAGSEFFGHEKGSYTNAMQSREGAFALADKGTLFLDEIGELPLPLQAELLRVIQEGTYKKVGSNVWQKSTFRLVSATNCNLKQQVEEQRFRQDLFYRISDFEFRVPSLKERADDIPLLADHFLNEIYDEPYKPELDKTVIDYLVNREYAGNVRELRQLIHRIAMKHVKHKKITMGEIPAYDRKSFNSSTHSSNEDIYIEVSLKKAILSGASLWDLKNKTMADAIKAALEITNGNKKLAAEKLGVTVRAVQQFLKTKV